MPSAVSRQIYQPILGFQGHRLGGVAADPYDREGAERTTEYLSNVFTPELTVGNAITFSVDLDVSIDGGSFATSPTITSWVDGTELRYRATSSDSYNTPLTFVTSDDGTPVDALDWVITTRIQDIIPDAMSFDDVINVENGTYAPSTNSITVTGLGTGVELVVSCEPGSRYRKNEGSWTSADGTAVEGDEFNFGVLTSATWESVVTKTLSIGTAEISLKATVRAEIQYPNPMTFSEDPITGTEITGYVRTNDPVVVSGLVTDLAWVQLSSKADLQYYKDGSGIPDDAMFGASNGDTYDFYVPVPSTYSTTEEWWMDFGPERVTLSVTSKDDPDASGYSNYTDEENYTDTENYED